MEGVTSGSAPAAQGSRRHNAITAIVTSLRDLQSTSGLTADVTVKDLLTGGSATMVAALTYSAQPSLVLLSAPSGAIFTRTVAPAAFTGFRFGLLFSRPGV